MLMEPETAHQQGNSMGTNAWQTKFWKACKGRSLLEDLREETRKELASLLADWEVWGVQTASNLRLK